MTEHEQVNMRHLLLAGGGHAHIEVLRQLALHPVENLRVTLVSPVSALDYSGMLPAAVAGHYRREAMRVDLMALARAAGADYRATAVVALDADTRCVRLRDGGALPYDILSLNIGSDASALAVDERAAHVVPVKPVGRLWKGIDRLEALQAQSHNRISIAVIGGGAGGAELALALSVRFNSWKKPPRLSLYSRADTVLANHDPAVRERVHAALVDAGVEVITGRGVARITPSSVLLDDDTLYAADAVFCATGAEAPGWLADTGLALDDDGFVRVGWALQSVSHAGVFAAGDISALPEPRPKSGVFAVRAAPILTQNLLRAVRGDTDFCRFDAPHGSLALITLGDRRAVASRGWSAAPSGYAVWRIKDCIDRGFINRYKRVSAVE